MSRRRLWMVPKKGGGFPLAYLALKGCRPAPGYPGKGAGGPLADGAFLACTKYWDNTHEKTRQITSAVTGKNSIIPSARP